jgi:hypothetical protein
MWETGGAMSEEKLTNRGAGLSFEELNNALVDVWESFEAKRPKSHTWTPNFVLCLTFRLAADK